MKFLRKFSRLFRRSKLEADMAEEMRAHLELQTERNVAAGMSLEEAGHAARRQFGGVDQIKERAREQRGWLWVEETVSDLRYAVRMLGKTPGVTLVAVLTLALGIGVNAALFAVYDLVALRPLPSRDPDELVDILGRNEQARGGIDPRFSYPDYLDYCAGTQAFSDLVAVAEMPVQLPEEFPADAGPMLESQQSVVSVRMVSGNYFSAIGAKFALGRDFLPEEAGPHAGRPVMVISHLFWQTHLHGDPEILGKTLAAQPLRGGSRTVYTIIGVTARDFLGQSAISPAGWIPLTANPASLTDRSRRFLSLIGRMSRGIPVSLAKADLDVIAQRLSQLYPEERRANSVMLQPGMRLVNIAQTPALAMHLSPVLLGFALVLVIACLNVGNLLLARGVTRQHEIGVRLVLGAGRGRIVRQLFAENFLLCMLGGSVALVLSLWTLQMLKPMLLSALTTEPEARNYVNLVEIGLDRHMLGFAAVLAVVAGLTAGLAPALHSVRRDGVFALKQEGSVFGRKMTPSRLRGLLLIGQVAVCLTLLGVSGLMTGKLLRVRTAGAGFSTDGVYLVTPAVSSGVKSALIADPLGSIETLRAVPGVTSACLIAETPLRKPGDNVPSVLAKVAGGNPGRVSYNLVSASFFEAFGVPLQRGRAFSLHEEMTGMPVVIVSETAAQQLWPGQEAVGQTLSVDAGLFGRRVGPDAATPGQSFHDYEVIGVSRDFRSNWAGSNEKSLLLFPLPAHGAGANAFVRLRSDSTAMLKGVELTAAAAGVPVKFQDGLAVIVDRGLWPLRAFAAISGALSVLALVLATVGLYGVMAFGVNQRVREIGVRMALGASAERVTGLFVSQGLRLVAVGVIVGLTGSVAFTVLLTKAMPGADFAGSLGFRVSVFAVVTILLAGVALVACWVPARRAAKVDPVVALRTE